MKAIYLFAEAGGFSPDAAMADVPVLWAANHWPLAVAMHSRNHPNTQHLCQDLHQANWAKVPAHDLLLASPCCQGYSKARGKASGNPQHDASCSTAQAVVSALEFGPCLEWLKHWVNFPAGTLLHAQAAPYQAQEDTRAQYDRDSRLCEDRDKACRERDLCKAEIAGLESSCGHFVRLVDELRTKADRYDFLRDRDFDAVHKGGVFAGQTPDNVVLNGDDLDAAIDAARAAQGGA